jgi:hypothetical protein
MKLKTYLFFFVSLSIIRFSNSQLDRLTLLGNSARGLSVGKSNMSSYRQTSDILSNPSLLTQQNSKYSISYTYNNAFAGLTNANVLMLSVKPDSSTTNVAFVAYQISNTNAFDTRSLQLSNGEYDFSQLGFVNTKDYGLKWIFANQLSDKFSLGVTTNIDLLSVSDFSRASAVGLDLGFHYSIDSTFKVGVLVGNFFGKYYFWNQNSSLLQSSYFTTNNYLKYKTFVVQLPSIQLGVSKKVRFGNWMENNLMLQLGAISGANSYSIIESKALDIQFGVGYEALIKDFILLRAGVSDFQKTQFYSNQKSAQLGLGFGLKLNKVQIDYTWAKLNKTSISAQKQLISIQYNFEKANKDINSTEPTRL